MCGLKAFYDLKMCLRWGKGENLGEISYGTDTETLYIFILMTIYLAAYLIVMNVDESQSLLIWKVDLS